MTTIAVGNQAGSAGKTTLVVNVGACLAQLGYRVRVIDLDAQGNASHWLGHPEPLPDENGNVAPAGLGTYEVLFDGAAIVNAERPVQDLDTLTIVPSHPTRMEGADVELSKVLGGEQRLRMALQAIGDGDDVVTLLDCPGSLGTLTVSALVAADVAVTVFAPAEKEAGGVGKFEATIETVAKAYNPQLRLVAVVPSIVPSAGSYYRDVLDQVRGAWGGIVTPAVRRSVRVPEAYSAQMPLCLYAPDEPVAADVAAVVEHLQTAGVVGLGAAR